MHYLKKECGKPGMQLLLHFMIHLDDVLTWVNSEKAKFVKTSFELCVLPSTRCSSDKMQPQCTVLQFSHKIISKAIFFFKQVFFFMNQFSCLSSYSVARRMKEKNKYLLKKIGFRVSIFFSTFFFLAKKTEAWQNTYFKETVFFQITF